MYLANILQICSYFFLFCTTSAKSITFSYRTCLPNIDLIHIEHIHPLNSQQFRLITKDFHLHILYTYENEQIDFQFGNLRTLTSNLKNFQSQYQSAINYYHQIDTWNYVNITFDDHLSRVFISFNNDETRLIPLIDYPLLFQNQTIEKQFRIENLINENDENVSCLLPYQGFEKWKNSEKKSCLTNIKTCEHRICTSSNNVEQYCSLFKIFDCYPFTDLECGYQSKPVHCATNSCQNQGSCYEDILKNTSQCICPNGFAGEKCQYLIDECQSNPCPKQSQCIDLVNGYTCVCDSGWTGSDCSIDIDECRISQPCKAAKTCINLPGSYRCECLESFTGQNCELIIDPCLSRPCLNNAGKCHSILNRDQIFYHCTCQSGFTGHNCEININDCEGIVCPKNNTICIDGINSFHCECKDNFKRNWDGSCVEQNPCDSSPCHQNATCYNLNGGQYRCMCPTTYTGLQCNEDIDECTVFPFICRNGGTCVNEIGSYRCYCPPGWTGPTCAKAIDYCLSQPCNRNGTCINKINGYECRCLSPYTGNVCQDDIDECLIEPCINNGTCQNYLGGFHCICPTGYFGFHCEYSPSECQRFQQASLTLKCQDRKQCIMNDTEKLQQLNQLTTHTCRTEKDRILDQYFSCLNQQKSDQCHCPSNLLSCNDNRTRSSCPCRNGGTCYWRNSTDYRCYCPAGLTGKDCLIQIDSCLSQPCYHNGTCLSQLNSFSCQCSTNYHGKFCQNFIDFCQKNPCLNQGICSKKNSTYSYCQCQENYSGKYCENFHRPCLSNPCLNNGQCFDRNQTFSCQCTKDYRGQICQEKQNLCQNLCLNGGICSQTNHSIQCSCLPGFTGRFCEININECSLNPCRSHGLCHDLINGYQCQCYPGWLGLNCENSQKDFSKSLIIQPNLSSTFHLRLTSINISKSLPIRSSSLPIRIQYEFQTTLKQTSLLAIGKRFQQELIDNRIRTNLDNQTILSSTIETANQWFMISIEIFHFWIDVRIGKNSLSQRFYISNSSLANLIPQQILFGWRNYSGCVRNIEISYSQVYSMILTDQFIDINENLTLGCQRTNACENAICQSNEICQDYWFYHICQCQRPFYGDRCDQIAPIIQFNQTSFANLSFPSSIYNFSLFLNTLQSNGTLFELISSNADFNQLIIGFIHGYFRLILITNDSQSKQYELRSEKKLNDGYSHEIQFDCRQYRLIIDKIYNETLGNNLEKKFLSNEIQFFSDRQLNGWFQDLRFNDQLITLNNLTKQNLNEIHLNTCYPTNPCLNHGKCLITNSLDYKCQCNENWFGKNCTEPYLCRDKKEFCPNGFYCKITGENQECLATATFEGNSSSLIATLDHKSISKINNELTFRLRARRQHAHLFTIKNLYTTNYFSIYLYNENFLYRDSILTSDLIIELGNETFDEQWQTFHFHWSDFSTLTINYLYTYTINLSLKSLLSSNDQMQIYIGNGFRGCLESFLVGEDLYIPFAKIDHDDRTNKFLLEQNENIHINNCTFNDICEKFFCEYGRCIDDFDRGKCLCENGWMGEKCQININECELGHNCTNNGICQDHLDGFYTCLCQPGFTGNYCEIDIDECTSFPCANDGLCIDQINGYQCNCTNGYINSQCLKSINETCFGTRNSCQNNGTCLLKTRNLFVENPQTECQCLFGYKGEFCEIDVCSILNCEHNSTCQRLINGQAKCLCTDMWFGERCELDINECEIDYEDICLNNGTCLNLPGDYQCQCHEHFYGKNCEIKHICFEHSPCLNHGQCQIDKENYICQCLSNYTGVHCEYLTCASQSCLNNGTCEDDDGNRGFRCNCTTTGYQGEKCELDIDECLSNPCLNNGTCFDQINGYQCQCLKDFVGLQCENQEKFFRKLSLSYHYIIWPSVAIISLLIILILLTVIVSKFRESRRLQGTYQPALNENGLNSRVEFSLILKPPPEERLI